MTLAGKTVVITAGAGVGIGRAMVDAFHKGGAHVVACDVDEVGIARLRDELPDVTVVHADVSSKADCDRLIAAADGHVDVLCNHAGIGGTYGPLLEVPDEEWFRIIDVNLNSTYMLCRRVLPSMLERGAGSIINTASVSGLRGGRAGPAYVASKFAVVGLTQNIAATYGDQGIRCNALCPGPTGGDNPSRIRANTTPGGLRFMTRDAGKPPPCPPEQVAAVAVFLAQDEAVRINGAVIPVDGGWIAY
jgi:NAD(P)-dependent dehydrogenase (short-subunit alcohol dehydrogenase family)